MENRTLQITYQSVTLDELNEVDRHLVEQARQATYTSYAPYSHFSVGAAVLLDNGEVVAGSNQENAAFGAGTCAERSALFYAQSHYPDQPVRAIAIAARGVDGQFTAVPISPCGICRQVLVEVQTRAQHPVRVILYGEDEIWSIASVSDLMPFQFDSIV